MTVTIELTDEQATALQAQAADEGMTLDAWLKQVAESFVRAHQTTHCDATTRRPIWESIAERMKGVPAEVFERLPLDGASEHDHYLYGSPKRNQ